MLKIPSDIYSHTKHLWDDIQAKLQTNTDDNTPFALLPIRLETRFMKVKRKWSVFVQSHDTIAIWDGISNTTDKFDTLAAHKYAKPSQEINAYTEISDQLNVVSELIDLDESSYTEGTKQTINETVDFLKSSINQKVADVEQNRDLLDQEKSELISGLQDIGNQCNNIFDAINNKEEHNNSGEGQTEETLLSLWKSPIYETGIEVEALKDLQFSEYRTVSELWVRIFPDDIHIHTHENPLTLAEKKAGEEYWNIWWNSGGDLDIRKGAWKALCELYGPQRAAWIKNQLEPNNMPQEPVDDDSVNFAVDAVFNASTNVLQNIVASDTFNAEDVLNSGNSLLRSANDLAEQFSEVTLSSESKEALNTAVDEYLTEMEDFGELVAEAENANIQINPDQQNAVDYEEILKQLSLTLLEFRNPSEELQFNANEWINLVSDYNEMINQLKGNIGEGRVDLESLKGGSKTASTILGSIYTNERVLMALQTGEREDQMYQIVAGRVGDQSESMIDTMGNIKHGLEDFKLVIQHEIKKNKLWQINNNVQGDYVLFELQTVFGQIKQNIANAPEPEPWNPFDHFNSDDPIEFPNPDIKEGAWTQAPKTFILPDRFIAVGLDESVDSSPSSADYGKNSYTFKQLEVGKLVPAELHVGIDPTIDDENIYKQLPDGSLVVDENMKWMVDFDDAVSKGMGIIMELAEDYELLDDGENVFDKLVVMGVKVEKDRFHKPDESKDYSAVDLKDYSKELMEELLINHHYKEDGMAISAVGTATNNTENGDSGWKPDMVHFEDTFEVEAMNKLFPIRTSHDEQRNGQRLADALGVDYNIFQHIQNAGSSEISDSFKFNKMLWHGTIGNYFQEMLSGLVSRSNYEKVKDYYEKYVTARGVLPTLRVGEQPYGFLPTTSFTKWSFGVDIGENNLKDPSKLNQNTLHDSNGLPTNDYYRINKYYGSVKNKRFDAGFKTLLDLLQNRWYGLFHQPDLIKHVNGVGDTNDFMQALGLQASTAEIQLRFPYSIANLFEGSDQSFANSFGTVFPSDFFGMNVLDPAWINLVKNGLYHDESMAFSEDNIANHIQYLESYFRISKNPVDKYKISENQLINRTDNNYIEWLRTADLRHIWDPTGSGVTDYPFDNATPPLLFKLLRQSYLMMHLDAFVDVSIQSGLIDENMYHTLSNGDEIASSLISTSGGNIGTTDDRFSKWAFLIEDISDFSGSTGAFAHLSDYKTVLDQYMSDKNISFDTTNFTFAQHVQNYYSNFWKMKGGYYNKLKISELDKVYKVAKTWSTGHIDRLFRENLDLGSYRLDAWMNGFVNRRLERTRRSYYNSKIAYAQFGQKAREKGLYLGAYGWLENIRPGGNRTPVTDQDKLPSTLEIANTTIFKDDDNLGFIHGPSVYHAMTAAILRSGYVSNEDKVTNLENPMAINLSSERVRMAKQLWEGIRSGQSLGALLGYQLERNLHELYPGEELDTYIYKLRSVYPIEEYNTTVTDAEAESIPAQNVINGINLLADIREAMINSATPDSLYEYVRDNIHDPANPPAMKFQLNVPSLTEAAILAREIDLIANAIDALGDLAVAEGVFQMSRGNFDRASTTIDTLLNNRNLPIPEILDTPRTGAQVSHRFCINMDLGIDVSDVIINPWPSVTVLTDKAVTAPHMNQFIAKYFPNPTDIKCIVKYKDIDDTDLETIVSVNDLKWQPIDFYTIVQFSISNDKSEELLNRIANYARETATYNGGTGIPYDVELTILLNERGTLWTSADYSIMETLPIIESLSKVISEIRPIKIQDFKMPELTLIEDDYGWDLSELNSRVSNSLSVLNILIADTSTDYALLLHTAENYNVSHASPKSADPVELEAQWLLVKAQLSILASQTTDILTGPDGVTSTSLNDNQKWKKYLEAAQIIFGSDFVLLPILDLTVDDTHADLNTYLTTHQAPLMSKVGISPGFDQNALSQWFYGLSRMRNRLCDFETLSDFDETNNLEFSPLQFPYVSDTGAGTFDLWYGWEFPENYDLTGNKTSVVMANKTAFNTAITDERMVGFVLDQWGETIPEKKEASGIAFHYDQPNTKPPQNVLIAVTPEFTGNWDGNDILFTLLDTIKMSKIRLIEPEHIQTDNFLGKYLPTTYSLIKLKLNNYNFAVEYIGNTAASS